MSNGFEEILIKSVKRAQKEYLDMAGEWLSHAPESFLQIIICQTIAKDGYWVYPDASLKKVIEAQGKLPGRPPLALRKRSDITVWKKSENSVKCVIEIKKTYYAGPIISDAKKIRNVLRLNCGPDVGYIVGYSEAKRHENNTTLKGTFKNWAEQSETKIIDMNINECENEEWTWGYCLLRVD